MPDDPTLPPFLDLGPETPWGAPATARVGVLPLPYEGTVSWGRGTADGPRAFLGASTQVELYDEVLACEPGMVGVATHPAPDLPDDPAAAVAAARDAARAVLQAGQRVFAVGGEHSLTAGVYAAVAEAADGPVGVVQLDAHADLRETYDGTPHSHACVMARLRETTDAVLQLGIRSLSAEEGEAIRQEGWAVGFAHQLHDGSFAWRDALARLPERIYLTLDVDALDPSIVRATGTPEPNGLNWTQVNVMLEAVFSEKRVLGVDVMELCGGDPPSAFAVARLAHRMLGWWGPELRA